MREVLLTMCAVSKAEKRQNFHSGKYYKWRKSAALLVLYGGISIGFGGFVSACANYFLSANSSAANQYGTAMIFIAFALIPMAIHALDRIDNPVIKTGS